MALTDCAFLFASSFNDWYSEGGTENTTCLMGLLLIMNSLAVLLETFAV